MLPKYVAVVRPRFVEVPFWVTFIGFSSEAAIELADEVGVCC